jgi:hypothetical protein
VRRCSKSRGKFAGGLKSILGPLRERLAHDGIHRRGAWTLKREGGSGFFSSTYASSS